MSHPNPECPAHDSEEVLIGCPCNNWPEDQGDDEIDVFEDTVFALPRAERTVHRGRVVDRAEGSRSESREMTRLSDEPLPTNERPGKVRRRVVGRRLDRLHQCRCACQRWWTQQCGPCLWCGR